MRCDNRQALAEENIRVRTLPSVSIGATEFAEWCNWSGIYRAFIVTAKHYIIAHHKMAASSAPNSQFGADSTLSPASVKVHYVYQSSSNMRTNVVLVKESSCAKPLCLVFKLFTIFDPRTWPLGHEVGLWNGFASVCLSVRLSGVIKSEHCLCWILETSKGKEFMFGTDIL